MGSDYQDPTVYVIRLEARQSRWSRPRGSPRVCRSWVARGWITSIRSMCWAWSAIRLRTRAIFILKKGAWAHHTQRFLMVVASMNWFEYDVHTPLVLRRVPLGEPDRAPRCPENYFGVTSLNSVQHSLRRAFEAIQKDTKCTLGILKRRCRCHILREVMPRNSGGNILFDNDHAHAFS